MENHFTPLERFCQVYITRETPVLTQSSLKKQLWARVQTLPADFPPGWVMEAIQTFQSDYPLKPRVHGEVAILSIWDLSSDLYITHHSLRVPCVQESA